MAAVLDACPAYRLRFAAGCDLGRHCASTTFQEIRRPPFLPRARQAL